MTSTLICGIGILFWGITSSGCAGSSRGVPTGLPPDTIAVRVALRDALQRQAPALAGEIARIDPGSLRIVTERSHLFPGVTYHWTSYAPRRSADLLVTAVVAASAEALIPIREQADWSMLLTHSSASISEAQQAVIGCQELIKTTSPYRNVVWPARIYADSTDLHDRQLRGAVPIRDRLHKPEITALPERSAWSVRAWFFESGRAAHFECTLGSSDTAEYQLLEEVPNAGLPRIGD